MKPEFSEQMKELLFRILLELKLRTQRDHS
jgi:hypothetical protein